MKQTPKDNLIPLSEAAKKIGTTRDYLNVLIHRRKLRAKKVGRNWFTTQTWLNEYLSEKQKNKPDLKPISPNEASTILGTTRDYINVLIRRGNLEAKKQGRNWITTQQSINKYLAIKIDDQDFTSDRPRQDGITAGKIELEKIRLQNELEMVKLTHHENLARIENERIIKLREIEKDERVELKAVSSQSISPTQPTHAQPKEQEAIPHPNPISSSRNDHIDQHNESKHEWEKQEVIKFFSEHLERIKNKLEEEKIEKQSLLLELQHLRDQMKNVNQDRVDELVHDWRHEDDVRHQIEFLRESLSQALQDYRIEAQQNIQGQISNLTQNINEQLAESKISDALARMKEKLDKNIQNFEEEAIPDNFELIDLCTPIQAGAQEPEIPELSEFIKIDPERFIDPQRKWKFERLHSEGIHRVAKINTNASGIRTYAIIVTAITFLILGGYGFAFSPSPELPDLQGIKNQISKVGTEELLPARIENQIADKIFNQKYLSKIGTEKLYFTEIGELWGKSAIHQLGKAKKVRNKMAIAMMKPLINTDKSEKNANTIRLFASETADLIFESGQNLGSQTKVPLLTSLIRSGVSKPDQKIVSQVAGVNTGGTDKQAPGFNKNLHIAVRINNLKNGLYDTAVFMTHETLSAFHSPISISENLAFFSSWIENATTSSNTNTQPAKNETDTNNPQPQETTVSEKNPEITNTQQTAVQNDSAVVSSDTKSETTAQPSN